MTATETNVPTVVQPYAYRAAEGEFIDLKDEATEKWMTGLYPAVMSARPSGVSEDYQFMDSRQIIGALNKLGMGLVALNQQRSRMRDPRAQEHVMRFRFPTTGEFGLKKVGDAHPELIIMNSHNGRCTIRAYAGLYRLVCANGMVIADEEFGNAAMRHFGKDNTMETFGKLLRDMVRNMAVLKRRVELMQVTVLKPHAQNKIARAMMKVRGCPDWVEPGMVLEAHRKVDERADDKSRSLWVTYNVIQENLTARTLRNERKDERDRSIRPLTGARADLITNAGLWEVLEEFIPRDATPTEALETESAEDRKKRQSREAGARYRARKKAEAEAAKADA